MAPVESALTGDKYMERTRNRKTASYGPEEYFRLWHERLQRESEHMRRLCEMYVTIHRRFRGVTISDQFGYFGTRPETLGYWVDHDPEQDGEVHPINIVRPDIRANVAALLQVNVGIDVEPVNQKAKNRERAERIQMLVDFFERDTWTESERNLIFDGIQKEGVQLIENYLDREAGCEQTIAKTNQKASHIAKFKCDDCDMSGQKEIAEAEAEAYNQPQIPCPSCGGTARSVVEQVTNYGVDETKHLTGEIAHKIHAGFNFVIDRKGARRKGIQSAKYLMIMELVDRAELEADHPQFAFEAPFEWSYQLRCQYALANADWAMLHSRWSPTMESTEWDLFEKRTIMLHESAYRNYVSPDDWEFVDGHGNTKLAIKRGQTWEEAAREMYGEDCKGLRLVFVNERLIDIETPPDHEPNFRKVFSDIHFLRDSGSYHSTPHWDSVQIQDDITLFNTLKTETAARNSVEPVWFNSEVFDINDFSREYIPSKDGALDETIDIKSQVYKPPVARSADTINEHLIFLLGIRREVSGVQPALLGEAQPNQPYAAQRQQLEQSFGLLTSASKSYAQMKVGSTKQKIQLAFKNWTLEQFQAVASRNGEIWNEADVAELTSTDLNRDVSIDYVPGTEVPQGNLTKELKFWNGVTQALPLIQAAMAAGTLDPDIFGQLLKRIDEFADFDFDLSGKETSDALAQKRYAQLAAACEDYKGLTRHDIDAMKQQIVSQETVLDPATGQPAIDEMGAPAVQTITGFDLISEEIMFLADIYISPLEDVASQLSFLVPEIMREIAKPAPNYLLIEMMTVLCGQFNQMMADAQAQAMAADPALQADKEKGEADSKNKEADREAKAKDGEAKRSADSETLDKKHEQAIESKMIDEASKENEREFQREQAAQQLLMQENEPAKAKK